MLGESRRRATLIGLGLAVVCILSLSPSRVSAIAPARRGGELHPVFAPQLHASATPAPATADDTSLLEGMSQQACTRRFNLNPSDDVM